MNTAVILIIAIPLIEIYLFIKIGSQIGAINTIALILITALLGVWYARFEGFNTLKSGITQLRNNELPIYEIVSGAAITIAAVMLIIPGFATDVFGILLIFPYTRKILLRKISEKYKRKNEKNNKYEKIIDGESEEIKDNKKD